MLEEMNPQEPIQEETPINEDMHGASIEQDSQQDTSTKLNLAPILIVSGDGGVGKTKLSGSGGQYKGFCFDMENGGQAVYPKNRIRSYNPADPILAQKVYSDILKFNTLKRAPGGKQVLLSDGTPVDYIVIDTVDVLQKNLIDHYQAQKQVGYGQDKKAASQVNGLGAGNYKITPMEQADWGAVKSLFQPLLYGIINLRLPIVFITHSAGFDAQLGPWDVQKRAFSIKKAGSMSPGISGGIGEMIFNLSRGCIYVIYDYTTNKREILTRPQTYDNKIVKAKDSFGIFPKAVIPWEKPDMKFIESWLNKFEWGDEKATTY